MENIETSVQRIARIYLQLAIPNEISVTDIGGNKLAVSITSYYQNLFSIVSIIDDGDTTEQVTTVLKDIPKNLRGQIAQAAISDPFRDLSPYMPEEDNRLVLYVWDTELKTKSEIEIREMIMNKMGRIAGYDNDRYPVFQRIMCGNGSQQ